MIKRISSFFLIVVVLLALLSMMGVAQERVRPREPLLYGLASFIIPGLGQYLNDEPSKALAHFIIAVAIPTVCEVIRYFLPRPLPWRLRRALCSLLSLGWHALSAIDAYETAEEFNRRHGFALAPM